MPLLLLFIAIPLIEIGLFIQIGGLIGLWPTLLIVLVTAIIGSYLVRQQGLLALNQVADSFNQLRNPAEPMAHGAMILFAGALLLTPGFFTDTVGFLLLVPGIRGWAFREMRKRVKVQSSFTVHSTMRGSDGRGRPSQDDGVIDGEFEDVTPDKRPTHQVQKGPSGWTKH
ncbi:FxsA family protein [Maritimibacter sp. DP1N21-5]|uniref:FxsA family protein n=1 Tax=Maritimibacter sp. DP1N21-5 TaxID=2836867 RepID=UPI001C467FDD|nr:FxsA family protein [Maritimibacter sp. DP1N21-5]MBV7411025.1 FxsA family protein [Maritimibacter sp. DP1N21-5]